MCGSVAQLARRVSGTLPLHGTAMHRSDDQVCCDTASPSTLAGISNASALSFEASKYESVTGLQTLASELVAQRVCFGVHSSPVLHRTHLSQQTCHHEHTVCWREKHSALLLFWTATELRACTQTERYEEAAKLRDAVRAHPDNAALQRRIELEAALAAAVDVEDFQVCYTPCHLY